MEPKYLVALVCTDGGLVKIDVLKTGPSSIGSCQSGSNQVTENSKRQREQFAWKDWRISMQGLVSWT